MVKYKPVALDRILYALSDPTRRHILDELYRGERSVGELAEPFKMSLPAISKHIKVLRVTELVKTRKIGREVICTLETETLMRVSTWLARYQKLWEARLANLKENIQTQRFDKEI